MPSEVLGTGRDWLSTVAIQWGINSIYSSSCLIYSGRLNYAIDQKTYAHLHKLYPGFLGQNLDYSNAEYSLDLKDKISIVQLISKI